MLETIRYWLRPAEVRRGERLLDEKHPGWFRKVDTDRLDMWSGLDCVLGQLYGVFSVGLDELGIPYGSIHHGFCGFEAHWKRLIRRRLREEGA